METAILENLAIFTVLILRNVEDLFRRTSVNDCF